MSDMAAQVELRSGLVQVPALDIEFIWNVMFSSQACRLSHWRAISPILCWITSQQGHSE